jgi:hypothetical protein
MEVIFLTEIESYILFLGPWRWDKKSKSYKTRRAQFISWPDIWGYVLGLSLMSPLSRVAWIGEWGCTKVPLWKKIIPLDLRTTVGSYVWFCLLSAIYFLYKKLLCSTWPCFFLPSWHLTRKVPTWLTANLKANSHPKLGLHMWRYELSRKRNNGETLVTLKNRIHSLWLWMHAQASVSIKLAFVDLTKHVWKIFGKKLPTECVRLIFLVIIF